MYFYHTHGETNYYMWSSVVVAENFLLSIQTETSLLLVLDGHGELLDHRR